MSQETSQPNRLQVWPLRSMLSRETCIKIGVVTFIFMLAMILVSNWLTSTFGFVPVGFGFGATAGVYAAGFTLVARDLIQDAVGRVWVLTAIIAGSILSFAISEPSIAWASAVAFLLAELADFAVYTPLRERAKFGGRKWGVAVFISNLVGAIIDTIVFIGIAFGMSQVMPHMMGQLVGKTWASLMYLLLGWLAAKLIFRNLAAPAPSKEMVEVGE